MKNNSELLTTHELASRLKVSPDTIRAWARRKTIPAIRLSRKALRFHLNAVLAALAASRKGASDAR
jgi:excisionase family DNA binding protein